MLNKLKIDSKLLKEMDWGIFITSIIILLYGAINIYIAIGSKYMKLQLAWLLLGIFVVYIILLVDYTIIKNYVGLLYWGSVAMLLSTRVLGTVVNGAKGWIAIGNRAIQPAEFAKLGMMLMLAKKIDEMEGNINNFKSIVTLAFYCAVPMILIVVQPDMGMTMVCFFIALGILFVAGLDMKVILGGLLSLVVAIMAVWPLIPGYMTRRITSFVNPEGGDPDAAFQLLQAQIGIGSGGFFGTGLTPGQKLPSSYVAQFVPEAHTDFIFSVLAENWGYIGVVILLLLYGIIIYRFIQTAKESKDIFGSIICIGVTSTFLFSVLQHVGMNIGIMPITGITLPLVSYGGSSVLTTFMSIGLVMNVSMRKKKIVF